jgi:hypothetical protein
LTCGNRGDPFTLELRAAGSWSGAFGAAAFTDLDERLALANVPRMKTTAALLE